MRSRTIISQALLAAAAVAAPAPQVPGYTDGDASLPPAPAVTPIASSFGPDSQVAGIATSDASPPPLRSSIFTGPTTHGPYSGTPTTTGAVTNTVLAASIPALPPNPTATYLNAQGVLLHPQPAPYVPAGKSMCIFNERPQ
jgi:hypothetical protein